MAAEMHRRATGEGQYMDISLVDAGLAWAVWESGAFFGAGEVPSRHPAPPVHAVPGLPDQRRLRHHRRRQRPALAPAARRAGAAGVGDRPAVRHPARPDGPHRGARAGDRGDHHDRTTDEWIKRVDEAGVPCGPVLTFDETLNDPHVIARDMVAELEHPIIGEMRTIGPPTSSRARLHVRGPAPWLGQHTAEVLRETGLTDDEIAALFTDRVVFDAHPDLQES